LLIYPIKMPSVSDEKIENVGRILNDAKRPMKERFRALFTLKNIKGKKNTSALFLN
jgi:deoxyhypusine monooxygenase